MASHVDPTAAIPPVAPSGLAVPPPASQPSVVPPPNQGGSADARNVLPVASRNKKEPRKFATPSTATIASAPPLLLGVSNLPFYTNQKLETNTFVPCALVLFAILAELDQNMSTTHRFLQSAPNWIPLVSQAYLSVIFYVHIFRVAREANTISAEQFQFLTWFESVYDFRTLMIPGPLVPVFQALAFTSGPFEWIGNIAPSLNDASRAIRKDSYCPSSNLQFALPSVPLIVDQLQWFLATFNITNGNEHFIVDNFYSNLFGVDATNGSFGSYAMLSPNARFNVGVSAMQYRAFKAQANSFRFPPRLATSSQNTYMTWFEFFRFKPLGAVSDTYQWFSTIAGTMQRYCQFVRGSVPMSAVSLTGLGASTPVWTYSASTDLGNAPTIVPEQSFKDPSGNNVVQYPAHFSVPRPSSLICDGEHFDPELEELAEQFSAATQVNVSFASIGSSLAPTDAFMRSGTVWTLPIIRESPSIDVLPTHGPLIMTHYHSDSRTMPN
jgi:hypothetical protein